MELHLAWLGALAVTAFSIFAGRMFAPRFGLVDSPDERKKHVGEIPLIGGIAIFIGVTGALLVSGQYADHLPYLTAAFLIVATGVWDDFRGVSPYVRLAIQALSIGIIAVLGGHYLTNLGHITPDGSLLELGWFGIPFTIIAGVGLINAFNMTDGLDGLCGSLALAALVGALAMAASVGTYHVEVRFLLILSAAVAGFLLFNFPFPGKGKASVFLGDAGSYLLGLSILYVVVRLTRGQHPAMPPVSALWFCLLPLLDMGGIMTRRIMRRRSPFNADREHLHHVFTLAKFSATETTGAMALIALFGVAIGTMFVFVSVPERDLFLLFAGLAGLYLWMIMRAWRVLRFLSRSIDRRSRDVGPGPKMTDRRTKVIVEGANDQFYERRSGEDRRHTRDEEDIEVPVIRASSKPDRGISAEHGG